MINREKANSTIKFMRSRLPVINAHTGYAWQSHHAESIEAMLVHSIQYIHIILASNTLTAEEVIEANEILSAYNGQLDRVNEKLNTPLQLEVELPGR